MGILGAVAVVFITLIPVFIYYKDGKTANVQKKKNTRNTEMFSYFFFPFAMLVIPNF